MKKEYGVFNFRVPKAMYEEIRREAEKKSVSMAAFVRLLFIDYMESKKK